MKVVIIYATLNGHTEELASLIEENLKSGAIEVDVKESYEISGSDLPAYDAVLIGTYTYGDGDVPDDMLDIYEEIEEMELDGKPTAVFGSGDTFYDHFAGAVDKFTDLLKARGGKMITESMKVDIMLDEEEVEEKASLFSKEISASLLSQ
ncbi:flavodoxin [Alkalicoccus halolimnae]|uniref:Flavodoxin n=1 Tax=Alkalicoccus halolimnae TaxID=1667239 RepID=A0A5C7F0I6_9BACI|nr:flavodoxin [Alkalicoccus halolimnae]TXF82738.1 flavodoxin [Alkalicoccus halolimnae]